MDFSKEYIKMCEKAAEIQEIPPQIGDFYYSDEYTMHDNHLLIYGFSGFKYSQHYHSNIFKDKYWQVDEGYTSFYFSEKPIFMPRQDQLQKMMGNVFPPFTNLIRNIDNYCSEDAAYWDCFDSAEQFWIGYIMKTTFNKTWNGEDWING